MYKKRTEDINEIREWLQQQKFLPTDLGNGLIHSFLWGCGGNKKKTKEVLMNYYFARQTTPELFTRRDPFLEENIEAWKYSIFVPLKGKQNGSRIYLGVPIDPEKYNFMIFAKQVFMCYDLLLNNNEWGNGDRMIILSYDTLKRKNLSSYTMYITKKAAEFEREKYLPGKLMAVHNVHAPPFMKKIHECIRPYITAEDETKILFHPTLASLHDYVSPDVLPLEFGGRAGSLVDIAKEWYEVMKSRRSFFVEEEMKREQETKETKGGRRLFRSKN